MSEKLNWKIVPGAEYRAIVDTYSAIPTAVFEGEDVVYYQLKTYHSDGTSTIHGSQNSTFDIFRSMYAPEDQSCITYLVAALMAVEWCAGAGTCACCYGNQVDGHDEGCAVAEALSKAEGETLRRMQRKSHAKLVRYPNIPSDYQPKGNE